MHKNVYVIPFLINNDQKLGPHIIYAWSEIMRLARWLTWVFQEEKRGGNLE